MIRSKDVLQGFLKSRTFQFLLIQEYRQSQTQDILTTQREQRPNCPSVILMYPNMTIQLITMVHTSDALSRCISSSMERCGYKRTVFIYHSRLESPNVEVVFATCSLYSYFSRVSYDHVGVGEVLHEAEELQFPGPGLLVLGFVNMVVDNEGDDESCGLIVVLSCRKNGQ